MCKVKNDNNKTIIENNQGDHAAAKLNDTNLLNKVSRYICV